MLQSYLNDQGLKTKTIKAMKADIKAERLVKGHYWNGKNGCFVGCVIRGSDHGKFETKLGIPRILARLGDRIFEGLEYESDNQFAIDFFEAIPVGVDLSGAWDKFAHFMLVDENHGVIKFAKTDHTKKAIQDIADMYARKIKGEKIDANEWISVRKNADAAAYAAASAAASAYAAYAAYASDADASAAAYAASAYAAYAADAAYAASAYADAYSAASDAYAAYASDADASDAYAAYAAYADAYAAYAADAAAYAADAARKRHYAALATCLISLFREAGKLHASKSTGGDDGNS
jgi:hypothetical protein